MNRLGAASLLAAAAIAVAACSSHREVVVVLPDANGHVGGVVVDDHRKETTLDTAGAATRISGTGAAKAAKLEDAELRSKFGSAISAEPQQMRKFILYFDEGTEKLTPESEEKLGSILYDLRKRGAPEVQVLGHTDRTGTDDTNLALSARRADIVRDWLVGNGVDSTSIVSVARGEGDPMIATDDGVAEPRNRRVEVSVR